MSTIVIAHGGVNAPDTPEYTATVKKAALAGAERAGSHRLDALETAVNIMEMDPQFNAGLGSVLNWDGIVQADSLIMDGVTGRAGAVAAIEDVCTPISVARKVMENTKHVLLVGRGATDFARRQGFPITECVTREQRSAWLKARSGETDFNPFTGMEESSHVPSDTVGAVVWTSNGIAAGVSTGGLFCKMPGRVGDSAIVGGGAYACPTGAAAGTGCGESFIELILTKRVNQLILLGAHPQMAVEEAITYLAEKRGVVGGLIAVDSQGRYGVAYNGNTFPVAVAIDGELIEHIYRQLPTP